MMSATRGKAGRPGGVPEEAARPQHVLAVVVGDDEPVAGERGQVRLVADPVAEDRLHAEWHRAERGHQAGGHHGQALHPGQHHHAHPERAGLLAAASRVHSSITIPSHTAEL